MWRSKRRLSQLDLASPAGVSSRHLSFVETGRSKPSREMVLHLAEHLDVPLRDRNVMLTAAGFAPVYHESPLDAPELASVRQAIEVILANHEPCPAFVIDGAWNLLEANAGIAALPRADLARAARTTAERHPGEPAPARALAVHRELRRVRRPRDRAAPTVSSRRPRIPASRRCSTRSRAYPDVARTIGDATVLPPPAAVLPMHFRLDDGTELRFFSTMTVFGSPLDVTIAELAIESFFPADDATAALFR